MKKLLPMILALALAVTSIIAFGTMFTGAEDPVTTVSFVPENLGVSADNGQFKFGYWTSGNATNVYTELDAVEGNPTDCTYPFTEYSFYDYYNVQDSTADGYDFATGNYLLSGAKDANAILFYVQSGKPNPVIVFTAPVAGTYTFSMELSACSYDGSTPDGTYFYAYVDGNTSPASQKLNFALSTDSNKQYEHNEFELTLTKGQEVVFLYENGSNGVNKAHVVKDLTATLDLETAPEGLYTAAISSTATSVKQNEEITVDVAISNNAFNASEIAVNFDDANFDFVSASAGTAKVTEEGKVVVENYGAENAAGTTISLTFKATENGADTATFTIASAKASTAANAEDKNLEDALITEDTVTVTLLPAEYVVTLDPIFSADTTTATEGVDFEFGVDAIGAHFNYDTVVAKIGDTELTLTGNSTDGWTISGDQITGPITVTGTRTAKTFTITFVDIDATEEGEDFGVVSPVLSATYGQPYTFTLKANQDANPETLENGWNYKLKSVVYAGEGGTAVEYTVDTENNRLVTIDGTKITDDIIITVEKEILRVDEVNVTVTGDGASEVTFEAKAGIGEDYTFTLTPAEGYTYEVYYTMGAGERTKLDGTTSFTIEAVNGHIAIEVTKEITNKTVNVKEYVKINGGTVYLVYVEAPQLENGGYKLNDTVAYYVMNYNAYAILVTVTGEEAAPDPATVTVAIDTSIDEALIALDGTYDVNGTGVVDANDAQLVYNIYNAGDAMMYDAEDVANMVVKYLNADKNGDKEVKSDDAQAIINAILEIE